MAAVVVLVCGGYSGDNGSSGNVVVVATME